MRYQERIYIQNDNSAVRNKDILNVNMSSDFCIFESPKFDVNGATKIQCGGLVCDISGYSANNILTAATITCLSGLSSSICLTATTWETRFYENGELAYSAAYYTTSITGDTPSDAYFTNAVSSGLTTLGYTFTNTGTTYTIDKKGSVYELSLDVCIIFGIKPANYSCPVTFSATPANDSCQKIEVTGATFSGSGPTIVSGDNNVTYNRYGAFFYPSIINNGALPVYYDGFGNLKDQSGGTISFLANANTGTFWANPSPGTLADGRLNVAGLSADTTWAGFTKCLDIQDAGTYYLGISADNRCRVKLNGQDIIILSGSASANFLFHSVFKLDLSSGQHIIEMLGENDIGTDAAFCAEIYYPTGATPFATLTAATSTAATQANAIFSTQSFIGSNFDIGTTYGYICPTGYALNGCGTAYTCTKIITTGMTGTTCSASCSENCTTICTEDFPYINSGSTGVYIFDSSVTSLPLSFTFTANTDVFTSYNTTFKYEIYKYNGTLDVFTVPPVYKSDIIYYSAFSATNVVTQTIPLSGLSLDGDYIVKGYYEADACTDFLNRLGKRIDTITYKDGPEYQLYDSSLDFYFVGITKADTPIFTQSKLNDLAYYDSLPLYQQVILINDSSDFVVTDGQGDNDIQQTGNTYTRSGSTITLNSEYLGDIVVTLNGLTLSRDVDYTLSGTVLTFYGDIYNDDIITIIYTRTSTLTLVGNTIKIDATIVSGATDTQGTNSYFYNTTTGKYEVYTDNTPIEQSNVIIILNGVTLAANIDYYQSISNPKRFILSGSLLVGDIVTIIYYPQANVISGVNQASNIINWYIETPPQSGNGEFWLEYSTANTFTTYTVSEIIPYQDMVTNYSGNLTISGVVGTELYYRVKNVKNYLSICGDVIKSVAYSEVIPITIQSNSINSY